MRIGTIFSALAILVCAPQVTAQKVEPIRYGDFEQWVTRDIKESAVLGGKRKQVFAVGPEKTIEGAKAYVPEGGTPWASSNVYARVVGITKTSNAVYPDARESGGRCAKLTTKLEHCKAIGLININVLVAGTLFTGRMFEPITGTSEPYAKMEMGVPFTKKPKTLRFDYKVEMPATNTRTYSSGFGSRKTLAGADKAEAYIILQRRWEDEDGKLYAKRVGTGRELFGKSTAGWVNGHKLAVHYGDISSEPFFKPYMGLIKEDHSYYARNSRGKMVPVNEVGWDNADATPTHVIVMFSSGSGKPYTGTPGMTLWVDNVAMLY